MTRLLRLMLVSVAAPAVVAAQAPSRAKGQPVLGARDVPIIEESGRRFRDLYRNGILDPYEDWRLTPDARARNLVSHMSIEEKVGALMHGTARAVGPPKCSAARVKIPQWAPTSSSRMSEPQWKIN